MDESGQKDILICILKQYNEEKREKERQKDIAILIFSIIAFIITIIIGTIVYVYLFGLSWIDALLNASLILTAIDIETKPITTGQKIFIIIYSLISVILFISIATSAIQRLFDIFVKS